MYSRLISHRFSKRLTKRQVRFLIYGLLLAALLLVLIVQRNGLVASLKVLVHARPWPAIVAILTLVLSYVASAESYRVLAIRPVGYLPTLWTQYASGFTNRLLPTGLGGMGLFVAYFRKQGHTTAEATSVVASNAIIGVVGNVILVAITLAIRPHYLGQISVPQLTTVWFIAIALVVASIAISLLVLHRRGKSRSVVEGALGVLRRTFKPRPATAISLAANMALTCMTALILYLSLVAVGAALPWPVTLLVLSAGMLIGSAVPTPGGLGGIEAGLFAGLVSFGVASPQATASVLLYRAITYWLPIVPGIFIFRYVERHYL